jgi:hypothetical protein
MKKDKKESREIERNIILNLIGNKKLSSVVLHVNKYNITSATKYQDIKIIYKVLTNKFSNLYGIDKLNELIENEKAIYKMLKEQRRLLYNPKQLSYDTPRKN